MQLKNKQYNALICLAIFTLLLGVGIQVWLGVQRDREESAKARVIAGELSQAVQNARDSWSGRIGLDTEALSAVPAQKRQYREDLHLELLLLVNPWNPVPEDYRVWLQPVAKLQIGDPQSMDVRCADELERMMAACEAGGGDPYVCSSYRTQEMQEMLFYGKIGNMVEQGWSWDIAYDIASQSVAVPGTSEHQLGLAADIIDYSYTTLDEGQERTKTQQWLMENSWRYGFILRYPNGSTDITGIVYEPWHYRYVGRAFAADIYNKGVTLEEYIQLRRGR